MPYPKMPSLIIITCDQFTPGMFFKHSVIKNQTSFLISLRKQMTSVWYDLVFFEIWDCGSISDRPVATRRSVSKETSKTSKFNVRNNTEEAIIPSDSQENSRSIIGYLTLIKTNLLQCKFSYLFIIFVLKIIGMPDHCNIVVT